MKWIKLLKNKPIEVFNANCLCCGNKTGSDKRICKKCNEEYINKMWRDMIKLVKEKRELKDKSWLNIFNRAK